MVVCEKICLFSYSYWAEFDKNLQKCPLPKLSVIRYPITVTRYPIAPPDPEQEEHAVEDILEDIIVQHVKPFWMMFYRYRNQCDTQYIKQVRTHEAKGDKP